MISKLMHGFVKFIPVSYDICKIMKWFVLDKKFVVLYHSSSNINENKGTPTHFSKTIFQISDLLNSPFSTDAFNEIFKLYFHK